jgi:hypothetical protein
MSPNSDSPKENFAKWERALRVLQEAIQARGLSDFSEFRPEQLSDNRWELYKQEHQYDVSLHILASGLFGKFQGEIFLIKGAHHMIEEMTNLMHQPDAAKLFNLSDENNVDEMVDIHVHCLLSQYINFLPAKMFQALNQTLDDSIRGYFKNVLEPTYRDHWKSLGLPDDFTLLPKVELQKYDKQLEDLRKMFVGDKRPKLTKEQLSILAEEHQKLRRDYGEAKRFHKTSRETFFNNNISLIDKDVNWRKTWSNMSSEMFPTLRSECLVLLPDLNYSPYELAKKHLALSLRYSENYFKNILRTLDKSKNKEISPTKKSRQN